VKKLNGIPAIDYILSPFFDGRIIVMNLTLNISLEYPFCWSEFHTTLQIHSRYGRKMCFIAQERIINAPLKRRKPKRRLMMKVVNLSLNMVIASLA
jgi:hypothetical protein